MIFLTASDVLVAVLDPFEEVWWVPFIMRPRYGMKLRCGQPKYLNTTETKGGGVGNLSALNLLEARLGYEFAYTYTSEN